MGNCIESCSKSNGNDDENVDSSVNSKPFSRGDNETGRSSNMSYPWSLKPLITRKSEARRALPEPIQEGEMMHSQHLKSFMLDELKKATGNFCPESLIGEGGFGFVYKGCVNGEPGIELAVAVKKLKTEGFQGHKEWLREVNYLGRLHHPNLVKLIGCSLEDENRLLVYEYMPNGSLENHLFESHLTTKCDVYSFGVVLLEILSGRRAIDKTRAREEENLVEWAKPYLRDKRKVFRIMDTKLVGQYPQKAAFMMSILALQCIGEVKVRPSMPEVLSLLEKVPIPRHRKSRRKGFAANSSSIPSKRFLRHN
ncbi:unnamed protein product [Thlaspi arvense]|uniref:non-specific serine/threonine protein kinase n=1 Tax=Thlaspi arvense TaxID=13288 RepID=A0AAU9SJD4_THLAR|nr:unnamed protein product [Thlaspi arvense]